MADADFSQIEYRTLVAMAQEPMLLKLFEDPDNDYHTIMASLMYGVPYALVTPDMRKAAKSFNFGIPYGMGFASLANLLHDGLVTPETIEDAKEKYALYFKDQPMVKKFFDDVKESARIYQKTTTKFNRVREYSFTDKEGNFSQKHLGMALRQAGNAVIQGTAADIFKIGVARTFMYIRQNGLLGLFLITNMIHDEQLTEINCEKLNVKKVLTALVDRMQMKLKGFPPLYVGAGIGMSWNEAKGKMNEIHPNLASEYTKESANEAIRSIRPQHPEDVLKYFNDRVYEFRLQTVRNYVLDEKNWNAVIHPVIGNLLSLQFDYGVSKEFKEKYPEDTKEQKEEREKHLSEIPLEQLKRFIEANNIDVDPNLFKSATVIVEEEEDNSYDEEDDDILDVDLTEDTLTSEFALIDESEELYGVDIRDVIREFGLVVSREQRICGVDVTVMTYKRKDEIAEYLEQHACYEEDEGAMQVAFLKENNVLLKTGVWVRGIQGSRMSAILRLKSVYA